MYLVWTLVLDRLRHFRFHLSFYQPKVHARALLVVFVTKNEKHRMQIQSIRQTDRPPWQR